MQPNVQPVYRSQAEGVATGLPPTYRVVPGPTAPPVAGVAYPQQGGAYNVVPTTTAPVVSSVAAVSQPYTGGPLQYAPVSQPYAVGPPQYARVPPPQVSVQMVSPQPTYAQPPPAVVYWYVDYNDFSRRKKWGVGVFLGIATFLFAVALIVDILVFSEKNDAYYDLEERCGWHSYEYKLDSWYYEDQSQTHRFSKLCNGNYEGDWCDTEEKGEAWLSLAIVALVISFLPLLGVAHLKHPIELLSAVLVIIAMLVYYDENKNVCWDPDFMHDPNLGGSGVLAILAIISWIVAAILRYIPQF